jgi:MOSC N-terminal beta barrel domain
MRSGGVPVGTVTGLWRYPVKSMAAEALTTACVSWAGMAGDRRWALVRPASGSNGFPWHTIRENPAMWTYVPRLLDPHRPDKSPIEVRAPDGRTCRTRMLPRASRRRTALRAIPGQAPHLRDQANQRGQDAARVTRLGQPGWWAQLGSNQ